MPIPSDYNYTATETGRRVSHNYNLQEIGGGLTEFNSALEEAAYRMKKLGLSIYEAIDPNVLARYCFESVGISEVLQQIRKDADRLEAAIKTNTGPTAPGPVENWLRTLKYLPDCLLDRLKLIHQIAPLGDRAYVLKNEAKSAVGLNSELRPIIFRDHIQLKSDILRVNTHEDLRIWELDGTPSVGASLGLFLDYRGRPLKESAEVILRLSKATYVVNLKTTEIDFRSPIFQWHFSKVDMKILQEVFEQQGLFKDRAKNEGAYRKLLDEIPD